MNMLPPAFRDLQGFVEEWALASEKDRHLKMLGSSVDELRIFYNAVLPRMDAIKDYLDELPFEALPDDARTLFHLAMTFVETAHPIDLNWKTTNIEDAFPIERFVYLAPSC